MIVVFGSINVDLVTAVSRLPGPGETVKGSSYSSFPGGKGANQALAARRAGAKVALVGAVGRDSFADEALALLKAAGVDLAAVDRVAAPTGIAMIAVNAKAENQIVVASGANGKADPAAVQRLIGPDDLLLLQFETPAAAVVRAAAIARAVGARVVLNAAPAEPVPEALVPHLDSLIVNEHEAEEIGKAADLPTEPAAFARSYAALTKGTVVVTLGAAGALAVAADGLMVRAKPGKTEVTDTTGAGDAFVGAFAAALDQGLNLRAAVVRGVAAGSLAVEKRGAQPSLPLEGAISARIADVSVS